ncbi:adenine phosphoribosyltransferase [Paramarasmius palmivorus]|uniref:adenine phosphoribosyltransferase n=1 Tax=Paramarasmius palmivorus TaxID=297713 RepID=A0AAW0DDE5_9AGAR
MADVEYLKTQLGTHVDFPKKGIVFLDIFPILRNPVAFETLITHLLHHITSHTIPNSASKKIDVVVGLDARGFLLGPILALRLGAAFVPVRKKGKLPGECVSATYEKEYGTARITSSWLLFQRLFVVQDSFEMQADAIKPGQSVIVVDDLIATGGSAKAAGQLVAQQGGKTLEYLFIIELLFLKAAEKLDAPLYSIIQSDD